MEIPPPPGYGALVPLNMQAHKGLGVRRDAIAFARGLHVIYITAHEFFQASRVLPVVFGREHEGNVVPVMITGVESGQNLFVDDDNRWDPGVYCPAYVRRYPFFTASIAHEKEDRSLVCVDEAGLSAAAPPLIDTLGEPTARWREMERFIKDMDRAQQQTVRLCERLDELDLLADFEADLHPKQGARKRLAGLLRVDEQRLNALAGDTVKTLMVSGELSRVYAHLMSLENFATLLDRYALRSVASGSA